MASQPAQKTTPSGAQTSSSSSQPNTASCKIPLPNCPITLVMGGPGSGRATQCKKLLERYKGWVHISMGDLLRSQIFKKASADAKWGAVSTLVSKGELAPEELTIEMVKAEIGKHMDAKGIIIEGFPRTMDQVADFEKFIGKCDLVFVLDCEEEMMVQRLKKRGQATGRVDDNDNAVAARITFFKEKTLPAIKYFDDKGKVIIVDGDRDGDEIFYDLATLFDNVFFAKNQPAPATGATPRPPSGGKPRSPRPGSTRYRPANRPGSGFTNVPVNIAIATPDTGRCTGLPTCPIILLMGGPGSGRETQAKTLAAAHPGFKLVSITAQDAKVADVKQQICAAAGASVIVLEGFPRNKQQLEDFNKHIGGADHAVLIDCEEATLRANCRDADITALVRAFKTGTLPILAHFDDHNRLSVVNGDRSTAEVTRDIEQAVTLFLIQATDSKARLSVAVPDTGRVAGLPACHVIAVLGAPGSGYEAHLAKAADKLKAKLVKGSVEEQLAAVKAAAPGSHVLIQGSPASAGQIEAFNKTIGGLSGAVVVDTSSEYNSKQGAAAAALAAFKSQTLPVLAYFDDRGKLQLVPGETGSVVDSLVAAITRCTAQPVTDLQHARCVFVLGGPGCGKGTQCDKIVEKYGFTHFSSGDLLRAEVASGSQRGKELTAIMERGELVSLDVVLQLLKDAISAKLSTSKGFLIDGYPREMEQGLRFEKEVAPVECVLYFDVADDTMVKRLLKRAETSGRVDDNEETIKKRLKTFHDLTRPTIEHYDQQGKVHRIVAEGTVDEIFAQVQKVLDK